MPYMHFLQNVPHYNPSPHNSSNFPCNTSSSPTPFPATSSSVFEISTTMNQEPISTFTEILSSQNDTADNSSNHSIIVENKTRSASMGNGSSHSMTMDNMPPSMHRGNESVEGGEREAIATSYSLWAALAICNSLFRVCFDFTPIVANTTITRTINRSTSTIDCSYHYFCFYS